MIEIQVKCDVCGNPKGSTNHWLIIFTGSNQLRIIRSASTRQWSQATAKHICGCECLHKFVDGFASPSAPARTEGQL